LRTAEVYGLAVHQTGSSIVEQAHAEGVDPLVHAVAYYGKPDSFSPHYLINFDGKIVQITNEREKAKHVGFPPADRDAYLSGTWVTKVSSRTRELWQAAWPAFKSPAHLFPGPLTNNVFIGVEMLPITENKEAVPASWLLEGRFSKEQHNAVLELAVDIAMRWEFPAGWWRSSRLCSHEDLNPIERSVSSGGWDPGNLREHKWFDLQSVRDEIERRSAPAVG